MILNHSGTKFSTVSRQIDQIDAERNLRLDQEQPFLFYRFSGSAPHRDLVLAAEYRWEIWRPGFLEAIPGGLTHQRSRFVFRWALHELRIFANREYQAVIIHHQPSGALVHYSGATGRYWRWPFMRPEDMQIGDTWTHPEHRGRGLAGFAAKTLIAALAQEGRHIWYVTELENPASMAVAINAGMRLAGRGVRIKPRFLRAFDAYRIFSTPRDWPATLDPLLEAEMPQVR